MASAFDTRLRVVGPPLGLRLNGETVTREIAGDSADTESQTAIVNRDGVTVERGRGKAFVFDYTMHLAIGDTVAEADTYLIDGERCRVVKRGDAFGGLRPVWLQRMVDVRTEAHGFIR